MLERSKQDIVADINKVLSGKINAKMIIDFRNLLVEYKTGTIGNASHRSKDGSLITRLIEKYGDEIVLEKFKSFYRAVPIDKFNIGLFNYMFEQLSVDEWEREKRNIVRRTS